MLVDLFLDSDQSYRAYFRFIYFIVDLMPFLFLWIPCRCFTCRIPISLHLTLVAKSLSSDVSFHCIKEMDIYVVPDVVIWKINSLHYLNYEAIP